MAEKKNGKKAVAIGAAIAAAAGAVAAGLMFWKKKKDTADEGVYFESFGGDDPNPGEEKASPAETESGLNSEIKEALTDQTAPEYEPRVEESSPGENDQLISEIKEKEELDSIIKDTLSTDG